MQSNKDRPRTAGTAGGMDRKDRPPMSSKKGIRRAPERGQRVAQARRRAGLSQPALAERVGVGRATIARVEAGTQSVSVTIALAIARELRSTVEALFGGGER